MYNVLETRVAGILCSHNVDYKYEKIFKADNRNGFLSVDFFINGVTPMVIEVTYWDDVEEKAEQIPKKFNLVKRALPEMWFMLVTKPSMVHKYKAILPNTILVLDAYGLEHKIAGSGVTIPKPNG